MPDIVLTTINARYTHASLGLRYLKANLGPFEARSQIVEFVLGLRTEDMVERILALEPRIVGLGVYIWNVDEATRLAAQLKQVAPNVRLVIGGPEVSYELEGQRIYALADHVITGPGDVSFVTLCRQLLDGPRPLNKVIAGEQPELSELALPYSLYSDEDIAHRHLYVEASRGCPFRCEFCLSALDKTAWPFETQALLDELATMYRRGARNFRFVDRTFNLKIATSLKILEFFLQRIEQAPDEPLFVHFELVPDHLPIALREVIARFPAGTLQFEIGIQTWNPQVQALISRKQNNQKAIENIGWLVAHSGAHLHVDLIAGLPGEDLASFGAGFDKLVTLKPHEIQVGILKRLRGAPIARHQQDYALQFNPDAPYNVLATDRIGFSDMQRIARFARYWDLFGNSGRFPRTLQRLLGDKPFEQFMAFCDWLHAKTDATNRLSMERQFELAFEWLTGPTKIPESQPQSSVENGQPLERRPSSTHLSADLIADYNDSGGRGRPRFIPQLQHRPDTESVRTRSFAKPPRQGRHQEQGS